MLKDVIVGSSVATFVAVAMYAWRSRRHRLCNEPPTNWIEIGRVEELYMFPIKSCAPIVTDVMHCSPHGPVLGQNRDRSFIIIDKNGDMVTGRDFPKLTQVHASVSDDELLTLTYENCVPYKLDLNNVERASTKPVCIWKTYTHGVDCGDEVAEWLSNAILSKPDGLRVLYFSQKNSGKMPKDQLKDLPFINQKTDGGVFSDASSFHLVSQASVNELNNRLETPVKPLNFRPNIVVNGEKMLPFEEDRWDWVKIGDVVFKNLGPCTRCLFTTVDPENGFKSSETEPLKTLRRFRILRDPWEKKRFGSAPVMGSYLGLRSANNENCVIAVGNPIFIPV